MDGAKAKDVFATVLGGGTGVDLFWTGLDGIVNALNADKPVAVQDCKLLTYGLIAAWLGFLACRDDRKKIVKETTITQKVTKQP